MVKFQKANLEHTKEGYIYIYPPGAYLGVAMVTDYLVMFIVSYIDHFDTPFIKMKKKNWGNNNFLQLYTTQFGVPISAITWYLSSSNNTKA